MPKGKYVRTEEYLKTMSLVNKGKSLKELGHKDDCHCCMCKAHRGELKGKNSYAYGTHPTKETRKKMSYNSKNHNREKCQCGVCKRLRGEYLEHKVDCQCAMCKATRGESKGVTHPCYGKECSDKTRKRISKNHKEKYRNGYVNPRTGKKMTSETKNKIGIANKGKKRSLEQRKKMSKSHVGKKFSKERREKMKVARAKFILPLRDTSIEVKIQKFCEKLNIGYKPHKYIKIKHGYCCDLFLYDYNTVIECDGDYWHNRPEAIERDTIRNKEMKDAGYNVIRLWEHEIHKMEVNDFKNIMEEKFGSNL